MLFSHCSEPSIPLSHFRALGECRGGAGQLPSAAGRSLLELAHRSRSAAAHYRAIGGAKQPHPRGKQEQNRAGDRAEHLRDEVGGALRTIVKCKYSCAQAVIRSAAHCGGRSRMHRRHMTVGLEAPARGDRLLPGERAGDDEAESDAAVDLAAAAAHSRVDRSIARARVVSGAAAIAAVDARQTAQALSLTVGRLSSFRAQCSSQSRQSEQRLYSAAPRVQSGTRKDHYRDAERQRDQQRPHRPQSARVVEKRAGRVRIVLRQRWRCVLSHRSKRACARLSADAQVRSDERMLRSSSGGDGSYGGGAAADEDEEHHRAELGPRVLDLPAHAIQHATQDATCTIQH